jgi:2-polyprenyl-3-methyl-5-hydroxy-6-metoxy-1,4-benzoquinol methylase
MLEDFESEIQYDTIIMSHVLEHIAQPATVLKRIYNLLKPDGVFVVSVPNAKSIHRLVAVQMGLLVNEYEMNERDHELGHYRVYDLDILKSHLSEAGFKIDTCGGYFLKPLSNAQIEQYWSQEMILGFYKVGEQFQQFCAEIFAVCKR